MGKPFSGFNAYDIGELSTITISFKSLPNFFISLTKQVFIGVQCSLNNLNLQFLSLSRMSNKGSAYFETDAVKITIS